MRRLIIRPGAIGDCLLALPAMEYLKADYTEVWISSPVAPLIVFADAVKAISRTGLDLLGLPGIAPPTGLLERLRTFDDIVSWYGATRDDFQEAARSINPNWRFFPALPPSDPTIHACDFFGQQVGAPIGLRPRISNRKTASRGSLVIHPFSGSQRKNWPLERFQQLAEAIPLPVEWSAGPEEDLPQATHYDNLRDLADWLSGASIYVGNDSGITHLAAAVGMPTVALFGPTDSHVWGPRGLRVEIVQGESMEAIAVETVIKAVARLL